MLNVNLIYKFKNPIMMKKIFPIVLICFLFANAAWAQVSITGKVTDNNNNPLDGATITEKGTNNQSQTNEAGVFTIKVKNANSKLVATYTGFKKVEATGSDGMTFKLSPGSEELTEMVVTALGIKKEKKALGASIAQISKKDIDLNPQVDFARILTGKAPGVNILATSGLTGSGTNITIRGIATITGNSQPLFVIDGVPFDASTSNGSFTLGNNQTSRFFDIDPNNIANVEVLKSLAATTLYGEAGANGVILVTTKTGSGAPPKKKADITISHSFNVNNVANLPVYNQTYGGGFDLSAGLTFFSNWGAKFTNPGTLVPYPVLYQNAVAFPQFVGKLYEVKFYPSVQNFFRQGLSQTTSINISGSTKGFTYGANYSYLEEQGFVINNGTRRNNFAFGGTATLSNRFVLSGNINYVKSEVKGPPTSTSFGSGSTFTSIYGDVMYTPTGVDLLGLPWENPLDHSSVYYRGGNDIQNPIWTLNNSFTSNNTDRVYGNSQLKFDATKWLSIIYRIGFDNYNELTTYSQNKGGTDADLAFGFYQPSRGYYRTQNKNNQIWDHTFYGQFKKDITEKWDFNLDLGYNYRQINTAYNGQFSTNQLVYGLLDHTNFVDHWNFDEGGVDLDQKFTSKSIGYFASLQFSFNDWLYLSSGARYSTSSRLEPSNASILYPNVQVSVVLSEAIPSLRGNKAVNFLKLRANYGSAAVFPSDPFQTRAFLNISTRNFTSRTGTTYNSNNLTSLLANPNLKPELQQDYEFGVESKWWDSRINFELSLYQKVSTDQLLNRDLDPATGYTSTTINAGSVQNRGIEINFGIDLIRNKDWKWNFNWLYSLNQSYVYGIPSTIAQIGIAGYTDLGNIAKNGSPLGALFGYSIDRYNDPKNPNNPLNGQRVIGTGGDYVVSQSPSIIGDPNALYRMTFINTLTWKDLSFRMQWDYTQGGDIYSATSINLLARGVTRDTEFDRVAPVILPGVTVDANDVATPNNIQISATQAYFNNGVGTSSELGVFDATVIRLREASLSYNIPTKALSKSFIGGISIILSGSNLWYYAPNFPQYVNFDPETSGLGVSNGRGLEFFTGPSSRRYGLTLRLNF